MIVFTFPEYATLANKVVANTNARLGELEVRKFADGERYMRIVTPIRDEDVAIVAGAVTDSTTLDIFDLACGLVGLGCRSLKIVMPFFSYSTMERAVKAGEVVTAKTRARLFSAIPLSPFGNQIAMLDLHSEGIPFYFEGAVKTRHLYAKSIVIREAKKLGGDAFVLGAVDAGRAKWVESLANDMQVPAGFVYKTRKSDGTVSVSGSNISVKDKAVVVYDDMIRSGGSILQACQAYKEAGASRIDVITTHGLFTANAIAKMKSSGVIRSVVSTDSHPNALEVKDPFLTVVSCADVFTSFLVGGDHVN